MWLSEFTKTHFFSTVHVSCINSLCLNYYGSNVNFFSSILGHMTIQYELKIWNLTLLIMSYLNDQDKIVESETKSQLLNFVERRRWTMHEKRFIHFNPPLSINLMTYSQRFVSFILLLAYVVCLADEWWILSMTGIGYFLGF